MAGSGTLTLSAELGMPFVVLCPMCGCPHTHVDDVYIDGRPREDGAVVSVHVDHRGVVGDSKFPAATTDRRHAFTLSGWCEGCRGRFAFTFRQHKGDTQVFTWQENWEAMELPHGD